MNLLDVIRVALDESVGTGGALGNCRQELDRRYEADRAVRELQSRLDRSASASDRAQPARRHQRPAS